MSEEVYLGDGCYGSWDDYQIWLRAPRENGDHKIALEPAVFESLVNYAARFWNVEMRLFQPPKKDQPKPDNQPENNEMIDITTCAERLVALAELPEYALIRWDLLHAAAELNGLMAQIRSDMAI